MKYINPSDLGHGNLGLHHSSTESVTEFFLAFFWKSNPNLDRCSNLDDGMLPVYQLS